jgi:hypothetical protein
VGVKTRFYSFFNLGSRWEYVATAGPWPLYHQERDPVPIVEQEAVWTYRLVWMGRENLAPTGVPTPDHPTALGTDINIRN